MGPALLIITTILTCLLEKCFCFNSIAHKRFFSWHIRLPYKQQSMSFRKGSLNMKIRVAIVGLPNVGKSTLFNALAKQSIAAAENFPFCTIDPNMTPVEIPDKYLQSLARLAKIKRAVSAKIDFIDVAGLVKGSSKGEGLGNRFLATVRECDAIIHVIRNYIDDDIIHVDGRVDPILDAEIINLEPFTCR
jgi:ribosome-binding ATPase YchF (GTP1/OBG family)